MVTALRRVNVAIFVTPLLFCLAIVLRAFYVLKGPVLSSEIFSDMKMYINISNDIGNDVWKTTHFFQSIGYPLIISFIRKLTSHTAVVITSLQALASLVVVACMYQLTKESIGKKTAQFSLFIGAVHLPWILYGNFALPETFFTMFLSLCALLSLKIVRQEGRVVLYSRLWGLFFIAAFWLKGTHALWGPLFLLSLLVLHRFRSIKSVFAIGVVVAIGLTMHGLFSYSKIGKFQLSSSTSGLNFIEGKCPEKRNIDSLGYSWQSPLYYQMEMHKAKTWDRPFTESGYFFKEGVKCIARDPFVLVQSFESIPFLFYGNQMWPFNRKAFARYVRLYELIFTVFLVTGLCVFLATFRRRNGSAEEFIVWVIPVIAIFLCVYIFKSEIRYRVPYDIWFIPIAVYGWLLLLHQEKKDILV